MSRRKKEGCKAPFFITQIFLQRSALFRNAEQGKHRLVKADVGPAEVCNIDARLAAALHDPAHPKRLTSLRSRARLLIPEYIGWNSFISTNIPILYNRYTMNKYPERLSVLGLLNYIVTILTSLGYWYCITDFLFLRFIDPNWALWALFALVGEAVLFFALENWNCSERRDPAVVITREGMRQIRAAKRVRRKRKKEGKRG